MHTKDKVQQLMTEAWNQRREGDYRQAEILLLEAETLCRVGDYAFLGRISHIRMQFKSDHGALPEAIAYCKQALVYYQKAEMPDRVAHSIRHLADLQLQSGQKMKAEINYRQAIELYYKQPESRIGDLANAKRGFAVLLEALEKKEEAISIWKEARELYETCNLKAGVEEAESRLQFLLKR